MDVSSRGAATVSANRKRARRGRLGQRPHLACSRHSTPDHATARFRRPTRVVEDAVRHGIPYVATLDYVIASRGGIPLIKDGKIIGAVVVPAGLVRRMRRSANCSGYDQQDPIGLRERPDGDPIVCAFGGLRRQPIPPPRRALARSRCPAATSSEGPLASSSSRPGRRARGPVEVRPPWIGLDPAGGGSAEPAFAAATAGNWV
jgi:Haem-degrading